ncbi:MAG: sulfatase [Gemmataceae bacterium]
MNSFSVLLTLVVGLSPTISFGASQDESRNPKRSPKRPNILWITVEDMSPRVGCYGDKTVPTPNIDRLAEHGIRFVHAFGVYGVCAPNRATIITGMYPTSIGAMHMRTMRRTSALDKITDPELLAIPTYEATPPHYVRCFTEYLRALGYYCVNVVKTDYQFATPLTAWDDSSRKGHWRNRPSADTPFFAVFNFTTTHESGTFQQRSPKVTDPAKVKVPPYYPDHPTVRRDMARHYDNIAAMDQQVGKLLAQLKEDGLLESTIIFFFSDHGDGFPRAKRWVYDSGTRVPMIVRFPDGKGRGTTSERLVSFVDLAPTVLSLAGATIPDHLQGQAFLGPEKGPPRKYVYMARDRMDPAPETVRAVRDERYQYVRNYRPDLPYIGFIPYRDRAQMMQVILKMMKANELGPNQWQFWATKKPIEELYDTKTDPHQIKNIASDPKHYTKLAELRKACEGWVKETKDLGFLDEKVLIKKLWPPDGKQPKTKISSISWRDAKQEGKQLVTIHCQTKGASVAYQTGKKKSRRWLLYTEPFVVPRSTVVRTRANRIGWKASGTSTAIVK